MVRTYMGSENIEGREKRWKKMKENVKFVSVYTFVLKIRGSINDSRTVILNFGSESLEKLKNRDRLNKIPPQTH